MKQIRNNIEVRMQVHKFVYGEKMQRKAVSGENECVCLYGVGVMCGEQAGLLLTAMAAPQGICRRKALLQLAMEGRGNNRGEKDARGLV